MGGVGTAIIERTQSVPYRAEPHSTHHHTLKCAEPNKQSDSLPTSMELKRPSSCVEWPYPVKVL